VLLGCGALVTRSSAHEVLERVTDVVFDKTGTLTYGRPQIARVALLASLDAPACVDIAAALEASSRHPIARAFPASSKVAQNPANHSGEGVEAHIDGVRYRLGSRRFCAALCPAAAPETPGVFLASEAGWLAVFELRDSPRADAAEVLARLRSRGIEVHLASGDEPALECRAIRAADRNRRASRSLVSRCEHARYRSGAAPAADRHRQGRLERLQRRQARRGFLITLQRTGLAIALASAIGIPVGLILGASEKLYRSLEFVVDFFRSTPATAIFPLFLLLFGVDDKTKIYVATFAAALAIIFNVAYGVMNARKTRLLAAWLMGARRHQILLIVLLESFPQTFIGLRTGVSLALIVVIVAEMFIGSKDGLGNSIFEAQQMFEMPAMYAAIFASGALGYGLNLLFRVIEKRVVHWSGK